MIILTLLVAQNLDGVVDYSALKKVYAEHELKASAQKTALKFYKKFWDGDEWMRFPYVSDANVHEAYNYYLQGQAEEFYLHLKRTFVPAEKTLQDWLDNLQHQLQSALEDNVSLSRMGWKQALDIGELKEQLHDGARSTLALLLEGFKNMGFTLNHMTSLVPDTDKLEKKVRKILESQTEDEIENLLSKYSDPNDTLSQR